LSLENFEGDAFGCNYSATIFDANVSQFNLDVRRILANRLPNEVWIDRIVENRLPRRREPVSATPASWSGLGDM